MRENEFRGKRLDNGKWVYGCLMTPTFSDSNYIFGYYIYELRKTKYFTTSKNDLEDFYVMPLCLVNAATIGQFTGLRDGKRTEEYPDGQKIYEDDTVLAYRRTDTDKQYPSRLQITYRNGCFMVGSCTTHEFFRLYQQDFEIIGNIYENGELLNG